MNPTEITWNLEIDKIVKKLDGVRVESRIGFYEVNGYEIDLTACGNEEWMVAKTILIQMKNKYD